MTFAIPAPNPVSRLLMVMAGMVILGWSGLEDKDAAAVTALGWMLAGLIVMIGLMSHFSGRTLGTDSLHKPAALVGIAVGALASLMTVLLMLFKNLLHGHVYPDYPPALMLGILERLPAWGLAGGLAGLGLGFVAIWAAARIRPQ